MSQLNLASEQTKSDWQREADEDARRTMAVIVWMAVFISGALTFIAGYLTLGPMLARWFAAH